MGMINQIIEKHTVLTKQAGIFRKQAKQQTHQIGFQIFAVVTGGFKRIMQFGHGFGGFFVDMHLLFNGDGFIVCQKQKRFYLLR